MNGPDNKNMPVMGGKMPMPQGSSLNETCKQVEAECQKNHGTCPMPMPGNK